MNKFKFIILSIVLFIFTGCSNFETITNSEKSVSLHQDLYSITSSNNFSLSGEISGRGFGFVSIAEGQIEGVTQKYIYYLIKDEKGLKLEKLLWNDSVRIKESNEVKPNLEVIVTNDVTRNADTNEICRIKETSRYYIFTIPKGSMVGEFDEIL